MNYEWDENKRLSNLDKHGIDFVAATEVFRDNERIETVDDRHGYGEERIQTIGYAKPGVLFVVYTLRDNDKTVRFISARKANKKEKSLYNSLIGQQVNTMSIKKYTEEELKKLNDETDYDRLKDMSDEEIEENAKKDKDSATPSDEQLDKFKKVKK